MVERKPGVLITGGSGLIGTHLTSILISEGYYVSHLSRFARDEGKVRVFSWDPEKQILDARVFDGIDHLIHLAGSNIGEGRWTENRKKKIAESRIGTANLLHRVVTDNKIHLRSFISASGSNYYGTVTSEKIFRENDMPGTDFLAETTRRWEEAAEKFEKSGIRTVRIRAGMVLAKNGGALQQMIKPASFGFVARTGEGSQYMPWIHITDLCNIYLKALNDPGMTGAWNAVAPQHVTQNEFIETLSIVMKKRVSPVSVPGWFMKLAYGEMADLVLKGSRLSSDKLRDAGFRFLYGNLRYALENVLDVKR